MVDTIIKEFKEYLREGKDEEVLLTFITRAYQAGRQAPFDEFNSK